MAIQDPGVIVGMARTPLGAFQGDISSLAGTELGSAAILAAVDRTSEGRGGGSADGRGRRSHARQHLAPGFPFPLARQPSTTYMDQV